MRVLSTHVGGQSQPALSQTLGGWMSIFRELLSFLLGSRKVFALYRAGFLGGKKSNPGISAVRRFQLRGE